MLSIRFYIETVNYLCKIHNLQTISTRKEERRLKFVKYFQLALIQSFKNYIIF